MSNRTIHKGMFLAAMVLFVSAVFGTAADAAYTEGELLVRLTPDIDQAKAARFLRAHGLALVKRYPALSRSLGGEVLHVTTKRPAVRAVAELLQQKGFATVSLNGIRKPSANLPYGPGNDPLFYQQWGLYNGGQTGGSVGADINAWFGWGMTHGSRDVVVAVVDTGVDYTHEDLKDNIWVNPGEIPNNGIDDDNNGYIDDIHGFDFAGTLLGKNDPDPMDTAGHGTHVSGIIGATGDNGVGVCGVNWAVSIMAIKAARPPLFSFLDSDLLEGLDYILMMKRDHGVNVVAVNGSYGGPVSNNVAQAAIEALGQAGIIFCAAAGNESTNNDTTPSYPASYPVDTLITVAATDHNDLLSDFSNYGKTSVDIAAPGSGILSTVPDGLGTRSSLTAGGEAVQASGVEFAGRTSAAGIAGLLIDCGLGSPQDIPPTVAGNIALILRGTYTFAEKVANAAAMGASSVVIYNSDPGTFSATLGSEGAWLPTVAISGTDGLALQALGPVQAVLVNGPWNYDVYDGTSMATPYVAGAVALVAAAHPEDDVNTRVVRILKGVDVLNSLSSTVRTSGRLNLNNSLLLSLTPPSPSVIVNGQSGSVTVGRFTRVNATVSLEPGTFGPTLVEYWVVATSVNGSYYYKRGAGWKTTVQPAATAQLQSVRNAQVVNQTLLPGTYTLQFGIDDEVDGRYSPDWVAEARITVQ